MDIESRLKSRLERGCKQLNKVLDDAKKEWPGAKLYLDGSNNLCLMRDDQHDRHGRPRHDRIIAIAKLEASGGDW